MGTYFRKEVLRSGTVLQRQYVTYVRICRNYAPCWHAWVEALRGRRGCVLVGGGDGGGGRAGFDADFANFFRSVSYSGNRHTTTNRVSYQVQRIDQRSIDPATNADLITCFALRREIFSSLRKLTRGCADPKATYPRTGTHGTSVLTYLWKYQDCQRLPVRPKLWVA